MTIFDDAKAIIQQQLSGLEMNVTDYEPRVPVSPDKSYVYCESPSGCIDWPYAIPHAHLCATVIDCAIKMLPFSLQIESGVYSRVENSTNYLNSIVITVEKGHEFETFPVATLTNLLEKLQAHVGTGWELATDGSGDYIRHVQSSDPINEGFPKFEELLGWREPTIRTNIVSTLLERFTEDEERLYAKEYGADTSVKGGLKKTDQGFRVKAEDVAKLETLLGISITGKGRSVA